MDTTATQNQEEIEVKVCPNTNCGHPNNPTNPDCSECLTDLSQVQVTLMAPNEEDDQTTSVSQPPEPELEQTTKIVVVKAKSSIYKNDNGKLGEKVKDGIIEIEPDKVISFARLGTKEAVTYLIDPLENPNASRTPTFVRNNDGQLEACGGGANGVVLAWYAEIRHISDSEWKPLASEGYNTIVIGANTVLSVVEDKEEKQS